MPTGYALIGKRYGRLVVVEQDPVRRNGYICWWCQCDCGKRVSVRASSLVRGQTISCRCIRRADIQGKKFGRLTVVEMISGDWTSIWLCRCECGKEIQVAGASLASGNTKSCGCYHRDSAKSRMTTHGRTHTAEYRAWAHAKERCYNENCVNYYQYGGRGIRMCAEWLDDFAAFYAHIGPKPSAKYLLDRIDNDGPYESGNVRWVTAKQSANNRRRQRHYLGRPLPWFVQHSGTL